MVYTLELTICIIILCLGGLSYLVTKYIDVRFEEGED